MASFASPSRRPRGEEASTGFSAVSSPRREDGLDLVALDAVLWPVYVRGALRGTNLSRKEACGHVSQREFLRLLRGCGLDGAQLAIVYTGAVSRHAERRFPFSAFKRSLCSIACRLEPELRPAAALVRFVDRAVLLWPAREPIALAPARDACASVVDAFAPCLAKVFAFFARAPTAYEANVLKRHASRADVDRMQQALPFKGWAGFAATFAFADRLGPDAVSAIFVDASAVAAADALGGLTLEEFYDAVLRAALLLAATPGGGADDCLSARTGGSTDARRPRPTAGDASRTLLERREGAPLQDRKSVV